MKVFKDTFTSLVDTYLMTTPFYILLKRIELMLKITEFIFKTEFIPYYFFSWEHSGIKVGRPAMPRQIFEGQLYSLSWAHGWRTYVAFIEGNFPQCGPQYIAVFLGTIPLP